MRRILSPITNFIWKEYIRANRLNWFLDLNMNTKWIEDLPTKCPPESAVPSEKTFYRLVETIPPSMKDFWSNWKLTPKRSFKVSECIAKACSIFDNPKDCTRQKKYTCHKHKKLLK